MAPRRKTVAPFEGASVGPKISAPLARGGLLLNCWAGSGGALSDAWEMLLLFVLRALRDCQHRNQREYWTL